MNPVFFTIVARNYLAYARTLCDSLKSVHPEATLYVIVCDSVGPGEIIDIEGASVVPVTDLGIPAFRRMAFRYSVMELSTAVKPYVFNWLFETADIEAAIYLDPDIWVTGRMDRFATLLESGASAVLTPHILSPLNDGFHPEERTFLQAGVYNLGFIAINNSIEGRRLAKWWSERLERGAVVDIPKGLFTDQKWADLMPSLFADVHIFRSPAPNIAYWNIFERKVTEREGTWFCGDEPVMFFHFSGADPKRPGKFSKHQDRYTLETVGPIKQIYLRYLESLEHNDYDLARSIPYGFGYFNGGTKIHNCMRCYFRELLDGKSSANVDDPFEQYGVSYFNSLERSLPAYELITRAMYGLYLSDTRVSYRFELQSRQGQQSFCEWFVNAGCTAYGLDSEFLEKAQHLLVTAGEMRARSLMPAVSSYLEISFSRVAWLLYRVNPPLVRRVANWFPDRTRTRVNRNVEVLRNRSVGRSPSRLSVPFRNGVRSLDTRTSTRTCSTDKAGHASLELGQARFDKKKVCLVGYPRGSFGVAENLRSVARALDTTDFSYEIMELESGRYNEEPNDELLNFIVDESDAPVEIWCVNADRTTWAAEKLQRAQGDNVYRIGIWFWELEEFPSDWMSAFDQLDEVWAPSQYIYETLVRVSPIPVFRIPMAVEVPDELSGSRAAFGLPEERFLFTFSYDFYSFPERKNAQAVIDAFLAAFPDDEEVSLVIKSTGGHEHPEKFIDLLRLCNRDNRIISIDTTLSRMEMYELLMCSDAYVSLHRAEGFGLGMAESMALGKPVIATRYSGNLDFMTDENSFLVDYEFIEVGQDQYPYWKGQRWANPSVQKAAEHMRKIKEDTVTRSTVSAHGAQYIGEHHSYRVVGKSLTDRIGRVACAKRHES